MDQQPRKAEQRTLGDTDRMEQALSNPEHYYPRPQDILDDDSLSAEDKRNLLENWQVLLQDRGGALEHDQLAAHPEHAETEAAVAAALGTLGQA
jgi:hypothetical protein